MTLKRQGRVPEGLEMDITWYGHSCFRLRDRDVCVVTDPFDPSLGYPLPNVRADIVTISHDHAHHNHLAAVKGEFKVVDSPGEYEIRSVFVTGIATYPTRRPGDDRPPERNLIFVFEFDGLSVCHLGDLAQVPTQTQVEALSKVDILMVPVGSAASSLNAAQAAEIVSLIEPSIVIPMHFQTDAVALKMDRVDKFLKEMGVGRVEPVDGLRVTEASLPQETQVVVLNPR
jgi:L-ascorbate metabolism protein UlaG (beta-lactamase superfamily)